MTRSDGGNHGKGEVVETKSERSPNSIYGSVKDSETLKVIVGASVWLLNTKLGAITDFDGNYVIRRIPAGSYVVKVRSLGYFDTTISNIVVDSILRLRLDVKLTSDPSGDTITIRSHW